MRILHKHMLDSNKALSFFRESLEETNFFSTRMMELIYTHRGVFFTLLPSEADLTQLHQFNHRILPELPRKRGSVGSLPGMYNYSEIPSLEKEISKYLIEEIKKHHFHCVFDNFNDSYNESYSCDLFDKIGKYHEKDICYLINSFNMSCQNVLECLYRSKTFWHSLCILTNVQSNMLSDKSFSQKEIQEICEYTSYVMIGAYDGEGYIFWERVQ